MKIPRQLAVCLVFGLLATVSWEASANITNVHSPAQFVMIDGEAVMFGARIRICENGAAEGGAWFEFPDGTQLELRAVHGVIGHVGFRLGVVLFTVVNGNEPTGDIIVATVRPGGEVGCDIWILTGNGVTGGTISRAEFEAETSITPGNQELVIRANEQVVLIDEELAVLEAEVHIARDGVAEGEIHLLFRNGDRLELDTVQATIENRDIGIVLDVRPRVDDRQLDITTVQITPIPGEVGCDIWILTGSGVGPLKLEAETQITLERAPDCVPADFGQVPIGFSVEGDRQLVEPLQLPEPVTFMPKVKVNFDNSARGMITLRFGNGEISNYAVVFGAFLVDPRDNSYRIKLVGVDRRTGHILQATVTPSANPDCQIWDLLNGATGQVQYTFEAETSLQDPNR